jgi:hypothetical protein
MALTTRQQIALHQILEVPWTTAVDHLEGTDNTVARTYDVDGSMRAKQKISERLSALDSEEEAVLVDDLDRWVELGTDAYLVDAGSVGSLAGLTTSPAAERELIAGRVRVLVPMYRAHDALAYDDGGAGGPVPLIR